MIVGESLRVLAQAQALTGMGWYGLVWYGMGWYGLVWYGMGWYGMVWVGMVWYGMVWVGRIKYNQPKSVGLGLGFIKGLTLRVKLGLDNIYQPKGVGFGFGFYLYPTYNHNILLDRNNKQWIGEQNWIVHNIPTLHTHPSLLSPSISKYLIDNLAYLVHLTF